MVKKPSPDSRRPGTGTTIWPAAHPVIPRQNPLNTALSVSVVRVSTRPGRGAQCVLAGCGWEPHS